MKSYESSFSNWGLGIVCLCVVTAGITNGQQVPTKVGVPTRGALSGRVFAITEGGDLKPARMADVYMLFSSGVTRDGKAVDVGETADGAFMDAQHDGTVQYLKEFEENYQWSDEIACLKELAVFRPAMIKTIEWALAHKKTSQIIKTQSDEEGGFSASLPPGKYHLLVRGRAGFNEALWDSGMEYVDIHPGSHVEIRLSSPDKSCLDVPD